MPEITGLDLRRRLLAAGAPIPMALMTAYPTEAGRRQALDAGIFSYLTKPVSPGELAACVAASQGGPLR
ncbi:CheY-like chemotaxis protein [Hansschlegelia beijingensis]|uniref:CheY-like chemotaxis protein n=2 Tax=Hansschlegelia beijingensis TaxID=1133344 RepID=A0A7W6D1M8_9HYPH|nr:CheY-like chemotaxis protein [Hansschlegelia beijingensis]